MPQLPDEARASIPTLPVSRVQSRDGAILSCASYGEGPTIVLVAGWSLPAAMWSYQITALTEQGFRCVVFDRRGHGRSEDNGSGYDYDTLASDIDRVLTAFDVRDATLVGYSFGSGESVRYLSRHGRDRVSRLLLLAPSTPFLSLAEDNPGGLDPVFFDRLREPMARDFPAWIDDSEDAFVVPETSRGMRAWIKSLMLQASLPALLTCNRAMTRTDFRPELRALDLPIAIVQGDRDASLPLPLTGQPTAALLPGAMLTVYEGAPHGLFVTHADRLNRDIATFARS
ncbi:MAG: alpha/beta hydrolase [Hydrogenophaga sp.]|nr:alpha/beta hydrolase [Hydrogenophaga sp.]